MSIRWRPVFGAAVCVLAVVFVAPPSVDAQGYCVDAQMNAVVSCAPTGSEPPAPLMKDDEGGGLVNERPSPGDQGCGRGVGFCCFCHTNLATSLRAPRAPAIGLASTPATFWSRHDGVARGVPRNAQDKALRRDPVRQEPYAALLKARVLPAR